MKVLFVDQFGKRVGRDTLSLAELLEKKENIEMTVYLSADTEIDPNMKWLARIKYGFKNAYTGNSIQKTFYYLLALIELKKYIIEEKFDVVHLQWFSLPWIEWMYVQSLKKYTKVVITIHDIIPFNNRFLEMKALDKIYNRADYLLMHTETNKKLFEDFFTEQEKISLMGQAFCSKEDFSIFEKVSAKAHFGIESDTIVFLFYGTIRPSKGLNVLIQAMGEAQKNNSKIYFLAAGAPQKTNQAEYEQLVREHLKIEASNVAFGFVPVEEEPWYFSAADVLCLPYLQIAQSGVAQLGLMYELPMIASDIGEMNKVIQNGKNGYLVRSGDVKDLTEKIVKIAENRLILQAFSSHSKMLALNEFSLQSKCDAVAQVYEKVLDGNSCGAKNV